MIRIRLDNSDAETDLLADNSHIVREVDNSFIAGEHEKNTPAHRSVVNEQLRPRIAQMWQDRPPLFRLISIETRSRCNMGCGFCPVNRNDDPREAGLMPMETIKRIANALAALKYEHTILLFGNNEPLLDERIAEIISIFRSSCPASTIRILTNATKLTTELLHSIFEAGLSTLVINNYTDGRKLTKPVKRLVQDAERFKQYDIRISVRKIDEVLTNRAGTAPNKKGLEEPLPQFCALPFVDLHISYTGQVVLCCFDAIGQTDFGNVNDSSLEEIWESEQFQAVRSKLLRKERGANPLCASCDFDGFRDPYQDTANPFLREHSFGAQLWAENT